MRPEPIDAWEASGLRGAALAALAVALLPLACWTGIAAAQSGFPLPPEPPAKVPHATTLPTLRGGSLGAEPPASQPGATTLPTLRGQEIGAEPPPAIPPGATLPSYRDERALSVSPPPGLPSGTSLVPNGNGTSTIIGPDGSVRVVPTPR